MVKGIIFDLDQTIIDSSIAYSYRKNRMWNDVYKLIPNFKLYEGFNDVFSVINEKNIKVCIVTNSPGVYAKKVVNYFNIPSVAIVDYFSTSIKKPYPEPMLKALQLLELDNKEVISLGDNQIDILSSNRAKIKSIACTWGNNENQNLINSTPNFIINHPFEIIELIQ